MNYIALNKIKAYDTTAINFNKYESQGQFIKQQLSALTRKKVKACLPNKGYKH